MNTYTLLVAVGKIDPKMIDSAKNLNARRLLPVTKTLFAIAACILIVTFSIIMVHLIRDSRRDPSGSEVADIDSSASTMTSSYEILTASVKLNYLGTTKGSALPLKLSGINEEHGSFFTNNVLYGSFAPDSAEIIFNQVTYKGVFYGSEWPYITQGLKDTYQIIEPEIKGTFTIDHKSERLIGLDLREHYKIKLVEENEAESAWQHALNEATKWAAEFLTDATAYEVIRGEKDECFYPFSFVRTVNGLETTDRLDISITETGVLASFSLYDNGWVSMHHEELDILSQIDSAEMVRTELIKIGASLLSVEKEYYGITSDDHAVRILVCDVQTKSGTRTTASFLFNAEDSNSNSNETAYTPFSADGFYVYPLTPDSPGWKGMTVKEKVSLLRIDEGILHEMTDEQLIRAIADYPYIGDIHLYGISVFDGIEQVKEYCDALKELLSRPNYQDALKLYGPPIIEQFEKGSDLEKGKADSIRDLIDTLCQE
jgi:hypothetical protein